MTLLSVVKKKNDIASTWHAGSDKTESKTFGNHTAPAREHFSEIKQHGGVGCLLLRPLGKLWKEMFCSGL